MKDVFRSYMDRFEYSTFGEVVVDKYRFKQLRIIQASGHTNIIYFHSGVESLDMLIDHACRNVSDIAFSDDMPSAVPAHCYLGRLIDPETGSHIYITTIHKAAIDHGLSCHIEVLKEPEVSYE